VSLYGVNTSDPDALRTAYAEIERVGAHQALRNRLRRIREAEETIIREVLDANPGVTLADLVGPSRLQRIVDVRQLVMFRLSREAGLSTPQIGKLLNRDHSTVVYAIHKLAGRQ
jgi:chromosomal replication initiation ATPase DnaA